jgi:hypothetical protein
MVSTGGYHCSRGNMIIVVLLAIYVVLGLGFIVALALAARSTEPKQNHQTEVFQIEAKLRSQPDNRHFDEAA